MEDGSFQFISKEGHEVVLSPEEMKKLIAQYEEAGGQVGGEELGDPPEHEEPVQEMSMSQRLQEGRVTKSALQKIIKEEYRKITRGTGPFTRSTEPWRYQEKGDWFGGREPRQKKSAYLCSE